MHSLKMQTSYSAILKKSFSKTGKPLPPFPKTFQNSINIRNFDKKTHFKPMKRMFKITAYRIINHIVVKFKNTQD